MHVLDKFKYCPVCGSSRFVVNNIKSKRCEDCGFVYYLNPSAATAAFIIDDQQRVLCVKRRFEPAKGTLDLPGGFVDMDETIEQGMAREVNEETHLTVSSLRFLFSIPNLYVYSGFTVHTTDCYFLCRVDNLEPLHAADDAESLQWIPLDEIDYRKFGFTSTQTAIQRLMAQKDQILSGKCGKE